MKTKQAEQKGTYLRAFRAAFPYTVPVLTGYLFIGMAFGVMIQEKGYNFLWAMLMSLVIYAGSGQYLAVNFFAPGVSLFNVIFMEFMVNIRHIFYGLSLLERFSEMGKKRLYMIFSLTDETYSLFFVTKVPKDVKEEQFLFAIAVLDQSYWIIGSGIGALLGNVLPFSAEGIDFAMRLYLNPIVILNTNGFFDPLLDQLKRAIDENFMRRQHGDIWHVAATPEEAVELVYKQSNICILI